MKGKIDKISIDQIINYYENPRHAIGSDERDTLKKLFDAVGVQYMLNLAEDIQKNGFLGCQQITVVYSVEINKYIVYEGNRRVACMKLLKNPEYFNFLDKATISKVKIIAQENTTKDLEMLDCYITDEEEALFIMERLHSGEDKGRGTKQWTSREKEIFKVRQNNTKTLSYLVDFYIKKYFDEYDITNILPFTTIQRIFNNREVKKKIGIDVSDEKTFNRERMQTIIDASNWIVEKAKEQGIAPTRLFNKSRDIEDEVVPWLVRYKIVYKEENNSTYNGKMNKSKTEYTNVNSKRNKDKEKSENIDVPAGSNSIILDVTTNAAENTDALVTENANAMKNTSGTTNSKGTGGNENLPYFFQGICYGHLDPNDPDTHGITRVCREIQLFSSKKLVDSFPMSAAFLVRCMIEHSIIYYSKKHIIQGQNKLIWEDISNITKLSKIIDKYNKNLSNYIVDNDKREYFTNLFGDYQKNVNPLNWVVHRPSEFQLDSQTLIDLPRKGLLSLINFFLA